MLATYSYYIYYLEKVDNLTMACNTTVMDSNKNCLKWFKKYKDQ